MRRAVWLCACMWLLAGMSWLLTPTANPLTHARAAVPLEQLFPSRFGDWRLDPTAATVVRPAFERARQFQMYDQVLERTYVNGAGYRIMLSVAYGREQSVGLQMHRPEVCYRAGGFEVSEPAHDTLMLAGKAVAVTRLLAQMPGRPEPITYWRLLGQEVVDNDTQFQLRQLRWGAQGRVADGLLVRLSSIDGQQARAFAWQASFAQALIQAMPEAARVRVMGS